MPEASSEAGRGVGWGPVRDGLAPDVRRVADRLRSLSQARLAGPLPPHASRAAAARSLAQLLAETAQGIEARRDEREPAWRAVPVLADFSVGDQVAVTGQDLLGGLDGADPADEVWTRGSRRTAIDAVTATAATLAATRRLL